MYQWEEELLEFMVENDIDYVEGRDIYLDESLRGVQKLLKGLGDKAMPAVRAGYKRVKKGGKWVLEKIKKPTKKATDAVDSATPSKGMPGSGPNSKAKPRKPAEAPGTSPTPKKKPAEAVGTTPTPRKKPSIKKAVGNTAKAALGAGAIYAGVKGYQHLKNKGTDTSTKPETSSPGSSSPGSSSPGGSTTKPGGSGSKPTPSPQTTQNPQQRAKNRSSWRKPVGRREHIAANIKSVRREERDMLDSMTKALFEGLPEPKVHYLKDMDPYDPRRSPRDHAPGSPLPPPSYRPGLPDMRIKKASKKTKDERKPKKA
jgi:hypothetical protein